MGRHSPGVDTWLLPFPLCPKFDVTVERVAVFNSWLFKGPSGSKGSWRSSISLKHTAPEWQSCQHMVHPCEDFCGTQPRVVSCSNQ